jgi:hypothetical protein
MTQLFSGNGDDTFVQVTGVPSFPFYGVNQTSVYVNSNSSLNFGAGTNAYVGLGFTSQKGVWVNATDRSYQWVGVQNDGSGNWYRVRYEGGSQSYGSTPFDWEVTHFKDGVIQLDIGAYPDVSSYGAASNFITNGVNDSTGSNYTNNIANTTIRFTPKTPASSGYTITYGASEYSISGVGTAYTKSLSDSIAFSETFSKRYTGFKSLSDAITSAETFAKQFTGYKTLSDSIPSSDSVSRQFTARKTVNDSILSSDSISKSFTATIIDNIATGDAENEQSSKLLNDIISSVDSVSSTKGKAVNLSDSVAITETIRKALAKIQSDFISSTDAESESINRRLNDVIVSTDSITTFKGKTVTLSDSITLTDALNKSISSLKIDSVGLSESFGKTSAVSVRVYDVIISTDHVDTFLPNVPAYNEVIRLTLEIAQGQTVNLAIVERGNYELDVVERKTIDIKL